MGKGNYRGETHEMVMFFTTKDGGFDVDLTPFVKEDEPTYDKNSKRKANHWVSTVTFKDYSFQIRTTHFNINILAEYIQDHMIAQKHPEFAYKIENPYNALTKHYFDESFMKFSYNLDRKETLYNPVKDEYTTRYIFVGDEIFFTHKGNPENYKSGSFIDFVKSQATEKLYKFNSADSNKVEKEFKRILNKLSTKALQLGNTYYNVVDDNYLVEIKTPTTMKYYITNSLEEPSRKGKNPIKEYIKEEFPEYIL